MSTNRVGFTARLVLASVCLCWTGVLGDSVRAESLILSLDKVIDIGVLRFNSVGGAAFDAASGNLWISDASGVGVGFTNQVVELNPDTEHVVSSFNANVIPGLSEGPDALALHPITGNLFLFSVFSEAEAGEVTQAGALVREFTTVAAAGGATFNGSNELIVCYEGWDPTLHRINQETGVLETSVPLVGYEDRISALAHDPFTGNLFAYGDENETLLELDEATGQILSTTDVSGFLVDEPSYPTGMTFNATGDKIYFSRGSHGGEDDLIVLNRVIPEPSTLAMLGLGGLLSLNRVGRRRKP